MPDLLHGLGGKSDEEAYSIGWISTIEPRLAYHGYQVLAKRLPNPAHE